MANICKDLYKFSLYRDTLVAKYNQNFKIKVNNFQNDNGFKLFKKLFFLPVEPTRAS